MKNKKIFFLILLLFVVFSSLSINFLNQNPITFFVLKNEANSVKAFKINLYLTGQRSVVQSLPLNARQMVEAAPLLTDKDVERLEIWSKSFGHFDFVMGVLKSDCDLSSFWNDDWNASARPDVFSNLSRLDRLYLSIAAYPKLVPQYFNQSMVSAPSAVPTHSSPSIPIEIKTPISEPIVRVEILNGCGIKGAAEWLAEHLKSQRIIVKNGGNADRFTYKTSQIQSTVNIPAHLKKALNQAGFIHFNMVISEVIPAGYDAVFIVGNDFRKIKGK